MNKGVRPPLFLAFKSGVCLSLGRMEVRVEGRRLEEIDKIATKGSLLLAGLVGVKLRNSGGGQYPSTVAC